MDKLKVFYNTIMETIVLVFIFMVVTGLLVGDEAMDVGGLFALGSAGLSYVRIAQISFSAVLLGILRVLIISDLYMKKTLLIWRVALLLFLGYFTTAACIIIFQWFPIDLWSAWLGVTISYMVCFLLSTLIALLVTKKADKKYKKQLTDYKNKRGIRK